MIVKATVEWKTEVTLDLNVADGSIDNKERILIKAFEDLIHRPARIVKCDELPILVENE